MIPAKLTTIGPSAFENTMLTGLDLSKATSLVEIGNRAFLDTVLQGTLVIPATEYGRIDRPIRLRAGLRRFHGGALACV